MNVYDSGELQVIMMQL